MEQLHHIRFSDLCSFPTRAEISYHILLLLLGNCHFLGFVSLQNLSKGQLRALISVGTAEQIYNGNKKKPDNQWGIRRPRGEPVSRPYYFG